MFWHNFKYTLKTLFKNKILIFWTFAFPILLGTFFNMAFSDIENSEKLKIINIAVIDNEEFRQNEVWKKTLSVLSDEKNEERLFHTTYVNRKKAKQLLEEEEIAGYISLTNGKVQITVNSNGIDETILRYVVDEIESNQKIMKSILSENMKQQSQNGNFNIDFEKIYNDVSQLIQNNEVNLKDTSYANLSYTMIEFYTLIAMSCLYGGILSMFSINYKLANMGSIGKRSSITPIKKGKMILGSLAASYVVQLLGTFLLFLYTIFVLHVDYGSHIPLVILLSCVGSLAGLSLGIAVGTLVKSNENTKTSILIAITMFGCFLSGMMGITMKYIVDKNIPIINQINPASMITDGLYSLYYYDTLHRYVFNVISLLLFSFLMIFISYRELRRQTYDSI